MYRAIQGGCSAAQPRAFHMSRPEGLPNYVLLLIRSCGEFEIDGKSYTAVSYTHLEDRRKDFGREYGKLLGGEIDV